MTDAPCCPICTMQDLLTHPNGLECVTCGHEWESEPDDGLGDICDANGNALANGDDVTVVKDLKIDGKSGGIKVGTKIRSIRLVTGDHEIDAKVNGRSLLVKAAFVKKA